MKFWQIGFALVLIFMASSCFREETRQGPGKLDTAIIFVPGFKGSVLRQKESHNIIWLDSRLAFYHLEKLAFKVTSADLEQLALPSPFLKTSLQQDLVADGIMEKVPLFLGLQSFDIYGSWLQFLQEQYAGKARIIPLFYDWRRDNLDAVNQLSRLVQSLRLQGYEKIFVIAHSMGGLITSYYLRYGEQSPETAIETWEGARSVNKVVLAGVPFRGAMQIFSDMQTGSKTVFNGMLLSPAVLNSFPSSYQLLPQEGVSVGEEKSDLYDPKNWLKYHWGYFRSENNAAGEIKSEHVDYITQMLKRADDFSRLLEAPLGVDPSRGTPLLNIIGQNHQALAGLLLEKKGERYEIKRQDFASGDDLVTVDSATLPQSYESELRVRVHLNEASHGELFKNLKNQEVIVEFLDRSF